MVIVRMFCGIVHEYCQDKTIYGNLQDNRRYKVMVFARIRSGRNQEYFYDNIRYLVTLIVCILIGITHDNCQDISWYKRMVIVSILYNYWLQWGRHEDLSTPKGYNHWGGKAEVNITFKGRWILMAAEIWVNKCIVNISTTNENCSTFKFVTWL